MLYGVIVQLAMETFTTPVSTNPLPLLIVHLIFTNPKFRSGVVEDPISEVTLFIVLVFLDDSLVAAVAALGFKTISIVPRAVLAPFRKPHSSLGIV